LYYEEVIMKHFSGSISISLFLLLILAFSTEVFGGEQARLLRYPSVMEDKVAFVYAGDIWTVPLSGGNARRITSFPEGLELFPKISPDGKWIAFSGEYAGTRQVYVVPYRGGIPKRLTYYPDVGEMPPRGGYDYMILDWTPDSKKILVRCNRTPFGRRVGKYYLVDPSSPGTEEPLQIPEGGPATFSPDGKSVAYNIRSREFRTWKRYRAGRAQDVFIYNLEKDEVKRVTDFTGTDNFPMWEGRYIYFTSDRERKLNLYRYDTEGEEIIKVTDFKEYDCLWPDRGGGKIIFENGGYLYYYDVSTGTSKKIDITLNCDKPFLRPVYKNVKENIGSYSLSPSAVRAVFGARGDVYTVPVEHGVIENITRSSGLREMDAQWSPDGKYISYLSEETGEYEIWLHSPLWGGETKQLTRNTDSWITGYVWSPDSKKIAFSDKKNRLWILDVKSGEREIADRSDYGAIGGVDFSPDSRWVCYTKNDENRISSIWVYSIDDEEKMELTTGITDDREPVFSLDGKYLYFVSSRDFVYREREWDDRIYIGTLSKDTPSPLSPLNDRESGDEEEKKEKEKKDKEEEVEIKSIDSEGFSERVIAIPEPSQSYYGLSAVEKGVVYIFVDEGGDHTFKIFNLDERESKVIMEKVRQYRLASNGKKFIYKLNEGDDYAVAELSPGQEYGTGKLDLEKMEMRIEPLAEWKQIYHDAWKIMRDWFYDPGLHGVDWVKMRDRYEVLLPYLAHRSDLDYIIGELIGELNAGHCYVFSGDEPELERVPVGLLGCEFQADGDYYRISKIYRGENWHENARSPLTDPGLNVKEGDYLISIEGHPVRTVESPYKYLENKVDVQVTLEINDRPSDEDTREINVVPTGSELPLFYMEWVEENKRITEELSGGRVGYIHVPNTHYQGFRAFFKYFQPMMNKDALIIDERYNGGGHIPFEMVQIMSNKVYSYWALRHGKMISTPFPVHQGPKTMLINGLSSSGGDAFPAYFRKAGLGPLIGETTWGGLIGYGYSPNFVDGGGMAVPGFAYVNTEGEWDVEAVGVDPDIYVFDDPSLIQQGREPMIEKAVELLLEKLEKNPPKKVHRPEGPDRS
jgi:tricorn protease